MNREVIINTIKEQQIERNVLLSKRLIEREGLAESRKTIDTPLAHVITGPRRAGKSVFAQLLLKDRPSAYLNFDDERLGSSIEPDALMAALHEVYGDLKTVFFDEIQNLPSWELFVNRLLRSGYTLVLTGSNAKLLSSELASALTGRHLIHEIYPFSFREYLAAKEITFPSGPNPTPAEKGIFLNALTAYLANSGFPEIVMNAALESSAYISTLLDSILLKDVIRRYNVRYPDLMHNVAMHLITNMTREYSLQSIRKNTSASSIVTVQKYLGYLRNTYLLMEIKRFSYKMKEQARSPRKIFLVDNGLFTSRAFRFSADSGRLLENAVFIELVRRGFKPDLDIFYYRSKLNREVDFITRRSGMNEALIQVCYDISDSKTFDREIKSITSAARETGLKNLLIITWDTEKEIQSAGETIKMMPFWKWAGD